MIDILQTGEVVVMIFATLVNGAISEGRLRRKSSYAHRRLHDATQQDNPRQENRVICGGLRHDKTKIGPCRRYLALLDHSRRGPIFVLLCRVVS